MRNPFYFLCPKTQRTFAAVLLFLWGMLVCLYYGRNGFHPFDMGIVWDGGWRILCGQIPYRDFMTPSAVTPSFFQALFFKIVGINWWSFLLHAAVFNGLFSLLSFTLANRLSIPAWLSFGAAACGAVVFYPPFGAPFYDQHAYFFCLLAFWFQVHAQTAKTRNSALAFALGVGPSVMLALLSKQVPTVFLLPWLAVIWFCRLPLYPLQTWLWTMFGFVLSAVGLILFFLVESIPWHSFWYYYIELPLLTGEGRIQAELSPEKLLDHAWWITHWFPFLPCLAVAWLGLRSAAFFSKKDTAPCGDSWRPEIRKGDLAAVLAIGLQLGSFIALAVTHNERANSIPFIFLSSGLLLGVVAGGLSLTKIHPSFRRGLWAVISILAVLQCASFSLKHNRFRSTHGLAFSSDQKKWPLAGGALAPLIWHLPPDEPVDYEEFLVSLEWLKKLPENFVVINHWSVLYALTGKVSPLPVLWMHAGLTIPPLKSPEYALLEQKIRQSLREHKVTWLVLHPQNQGRLKDYPFIEKWYEANRPNTLRIGAFDMVPIGAEVSGEKGEILPPQPRSTSF